jgi:methyltransferase-like protein
MRQLDLLQTPAELGPFDYIIAHGLYSWVAEPVRDKLLAVCGAHLTENGVAYVSYNVYPGSHFRDLTRRMMRYHAAKFSDPDQKVHQARALIKVLAESKKQEPEPYHQILQQELDRALTRSDAALFHDDLNAINQPVYFHEFIEHARRHGLQYLSEASLRAMPVSSFRSNVIEQLNKLDPTDVVTREQYNDFLMCRAFRQTLVCPNKISLYQAHPSERVARLRCAADLRCEASLADLRSASPVMFKNPAGSELAPDRPLVKTALARLGAVWPQSVAFDDLVNSVRSELGNDISGQDNTDQQLSEALLQAHLADYVEFHAYQAPFVTSVSEQPMASALARLQLQRGIAISTLRHQSIKVEGALSRNLILLLDGTRDRSALLCDLGGLVKSGEATFSVDGTPIYDPDLALAELSQGLEKNLADLARLGVLVA